MQDGIKEIEQYSLQLQDDELNLLTKSAKASSSLDKKFYLELNALLNDNADDDEKGVAEGKFSATSLESGVDNIDVQMLDKEHVSAAARNKAFGPTSLGERLSSQPAITLESADTLSVEIPDYSPDFNSESEKISNMLQEEKSSDNNAR